MEIIDIVDEIGSNFIEGSNEINTNRAFPNALDGLKPVQRACIWEMFVKNYNSSKPHVKSAKISGGVIATWHPHGDQATYESFVHMSQPFSNIVPTVDFHGANGNVILGGGAYASSRYTEARLAGITEDGMLYGINKDNVDMILNFSEDEEWPAVLPAVFPNLLVNGTEGIGVGLANIFLPHDFNETADMLIKYMQTGEIDNESYYPDFPTGGVIVNKDELHVINETGRGKVIVEAKYEIRKNEINFYEMPYQVYIEPVIEEIKEAIDSDKITGIVNVINKSDKKRICLTIECARGASPELVVEQLFQYTPLRSQYNANQNAIVDKIPELLTLGQIAKIYVDHNTSCIKREHAFDLAKAKERLHIIDGLLVALDNIDVVIDIIRNSDSPSMELIEKFKLDSAQVSAILDIKLSRLAKLEVDKLLKEKADKEKVVETCTKVVESFDEQKSILISRLSALCKRYGTKRKSDVIQKTVNNIKSKSATKKAVEAAESVIVSINANGYAKSILVPQPSRNVAGNILYEKTDTSDMLMLFSNHGNVFRISVSDIKKCSQTDKGTALGSILQLGDNEKILCASLTNHMQPYDFLFFGTKNGLVKKSLVSLYTGNTRNIRGMKACGIKDGDEIVSMFFINDEDKISILTNDVYEINIESNSFSESGKTAAGVKGISLHDGDYVKTYSVADNSVRCQNRGGKGKKKS